MSHRNPLENVFLGVLQGRRAGIERHRRDPRVATYTREYLALSRSQAGLLLRPQIPCRSFGELVRTRFANQHRDFVVRWPPPVLGDKDFYRLVALVAPLAESREQFGGNAADLEAGIPPSFVALALSLITQGADFTGERVAVDLRQVCSALINLRRL